MVKISTKALAVFLHGRRVGRLSYDGTRYEFSYDDEYLSFIKAIPVSLSLPLTKEIYRGDMGGKHLPHYFHHLLPEGWLLNLAKILKMPVESPMDLLGLLCVDTVGAIKILKDDVEAKQVTKKSGTSSLEAESDIFIATQKTPDKATNIFKHAFCLYCGKRLVRPGYNDNYHPQCSMLLFDSEETPRFEIDRDRIKDIAAKQLKNGESLTGVQEKFSLRHRKDRKTLLAPMSRFVAKPQPTAKDLEEITALEACYMLFARLLGLRVASSGIIYLSDGSPCFISRRFDIASDGSRIHQEDFAGVMKKYNKYDSSHEGIAKILLQNSSISDDERRKESLAFFQMTLFNFFLGNTDAHLKNFSLFHSYAQNGPIYRLTPFYDIFPSLLYAPNDTDELGLMLDDRKNRFSRKDFAELVNKLNLGPRTLSSFIDKFTESRSLLIQCLDVFRVSQERKYKIMELAGRRLEQLR